MKPQGARLETCVEMRHGQVLSVVTNHDGSLVRVDELMPPRLPSDRLPHHSAVDEAAARERDWREAFARSLDA